MISFPFLFTITMVMKGNQNNLDQRKDILDIKDRSILCPQSSFFWLSRHCLLQSRYLRTTLIATAIESNTKVCTMFGVRRAVEHYEGWGGVLGKGGCVCYSDVAICSNFFNCNNSAEQYQIDGFKASQTKSSRMHFCFCITSTRVSLLTMDNLSKVVRDRN